MSDGAEDPVLRRRRLIATWCAQGRRVGFGLYGVAVVLFFVGMSVGFGSGIATAIVVALVIGAVVLVPAIVFGYAARAAERDEANG